MSGRNEANPKLAFYYPNPMWGSSDWIKNLILFFDGVALLVPEYMRHRPYDIDPAVTHGLAEHGLLTILEPETLIDRKAAEELASSMTDIIASGSLDDLAKTPAVFQELSYSRLGYTADAGLAEMLLEELQSRGLARESEDGLSIPMHRTVRTLVLILLAQVLRRPGMERGLELCPTTDVPQVEQSLRQLLSLPSMPSSDRVVSLDLEAVGVDLSAVPIEEILKFRVEHGDEYQQYAQDLRQFMREIGNLPAESQEEAIRDRRDEIQSRAKELHAVAYRTWAKVGSFSFGLAGASWQVASDDLFGRALQLGAAALAGLALADRPKAEAYSYLFRAKDRFRYQ